MERWPSGRRRTPGERVTVKSCPWVQIPLSPPSRIINAGKFPAFIILFSYFTVSFIPAFIAFRFISNNFPFFPVNFSFKASSTASKLTACVAFK
ncbi:MAG: hypothetical protein PWQ66_144 [Petrotoga sp.]|nr:hypothetical protein [Petrotoga sp.]